MPVYHTIRSANARINKLHSGADRLQRPFRSEAAARALMRRARRLAAHGTGAHLVRREDGLRLGHACRAMLFAHEPARPVRPAQMPGALNLFVHGTQSLVRGADRAATARSEEHTSELQSRPHLVCRLLLEKK